MIQPVIHIDGVSISRNGVPILRDIGWTVEPGEHWAVLGPNGCGKTVLMNAVTGYDWPGEGRVRVLGEELGRVHVQALRMRIGMVSSALAQRFPARETVREVVASGRFASLGLYESPAGEDLARAKELAGRLGLANLLERPWGALSFGERQRTMTARALMANPDLLILDEPCEGLDIAGRELLLRMVDMVIAAPDGPTVIMVTHRVEEICAGIGHALLLRGGRVESAGPKEETLTAANLSRTMGVAVDLRRRDGRYYAVVAGQ